MSSSEKRYFRLFTKGLSSKPGSNLKIFELMDAQESCNEKELIKKLGNLKLQKQFPVLKSHLYKQLLKCLRNYHSGKTIDIRIKEHLMNAELLLNRDLVSQAGKQMDKALRLVEVNGRPEYFPEISQLRLSLFIQLGHQRIGEAEEGLKKERQDFGKMLEEIKLIQEYRFLSLQMLLLNRREAVARSPKSKKAWQEAIQAPLLQAKPPDFPVSAKLFYHQSHLFYSISQSEFRKAYGHVSLIIALMEEHTCLIRDKPENYVHSLQNQIAIASYCLPLHETLNLLKRFKELEQRLPKIRISGFSKRNLNLYAYTQELELLIREKKMEKVAELIPVVRVFLLDKGLKVNINEGFLMFNLSLNVIHFDLFQGNFHLALEGVNQLLNAKDVSRDYEIFLQARFIRIILLLELGEEELLESAMLSLYRFLQNRQMLQRFERAFFHFVRKCLRLQYGKSRGHLFSELRKEMIRISAVEPLPLEPFDIISWLKKMTVMNI